MGSRKSISSSCFVLRHSLTSIYHGNLSNKQCFLALLLRLSIELHCHLWALVDYLTLVGSLHSVFTPCCPLLWWSECTLCCGQPSFLWENQTFGHWLSYCSRENLFKINEIIANFDLWLASKALTFRSFSSFFSKLSLLDIF